MHDIARMAVQTQTMKGDGYFPCVSVGTGSRTLPEYLCATCNERMKNGWRMKEIDEMDMPGFLRLRA